MTAERIGRLLTGAIGLLLIVGLVAARLLPAGVLVLSLPFLYVLGTKPVLRRLALRNASRRPKETALILLGSLLGTAIITGSLIVGDTLHDSIRHNAYTQLGPVDETISLPGVALPAEVMTVASHLPPADVAGTLAMTILPVTASTSPPGRLAEPTAQLIETDFTRARALGPSPAATGISGPGPGPGQTVIGRDLANAIHVRVGDTVAVFAYGHSHTFRVARILPRTGIAGLQLGRSTVSPNLFVPPGTIAAIVASDSSTPAGAATVRSAPPQAVLAIANRGTVLSGAARTAAVTAELTRALPSQVQTVIRPVKKDLLDAANAQGAQFSQLFQSIGFFSVLAGILLLVNIFVMLAQERKTELGMLRAVGLRRASLVGSFSLEGWMYALGSSVLGTIAGLGVGRGVAAVASGIFARRGAFGLELHFAAHLSSIQAGFTEGFVISLLTVLATSLFIARLNVIRAIRDLPEPESRGHPALRIGLGVAGLLLGLAMTSSGVSGKSPVPLLVGPAFIGLGVVQLFGRLLPRRPVVSLAAAAVLTWGMVVNSLVPDAFKGGVIAAFIAQGMVLVGAGIALVSQNQDLIGRALRRVAGPRNLPIRLGLAYPLAKRFRTTLILSMYVLVVFMLILVSVLSHLFGAQVDDFTRKISGGYAVEAFSNPTNPIPADQVAALPGVKGVAPIQEVYGQFASHLSDNKLLFWPGGTYDERYIQLGAPKLAKRGAFPDDQSAYRGLLSDPNGLIVSQFFLQNGGGPPKGSPAVGDQVTVQDPVTGRSRQLHIIAVSESGFGNILALMAPQTVHAIFGDRATPNDLFIATNPGISGQSLADRINTQFLTNGADASTFRKLVTDNLSTQLQFFRLMQGYIALGLVVGIAGLGVVMVRAVRERRRQVGVLRALGFDGRAVRRAFTAESAFVTAEGVIVGMLLANVMAWRLSANKAFGGLHYSLPWLSLVVLGLGTFLASLLATAAPAKQASRIRPAVALRMTD